MDHSILYFAYGSNMSIERLRARVPGARFVGVAVLTGYVLKFHKPGKTDGSGKCDASHTGDDEDRIHGALYKIAESDLTALDRFEGHGQGYDRTLVTVMEAIASPVRAYTYLATRFDPSLRPLDWYKEHVLRGARAIGLPAAYVAAIEAVECDADTDTERRLRELAVYQ